MDEDNSSIPETPKGGIGDSRTATAPDSNESAISGIRSDAGSPAEVVAKRTDQLSPRMTCGAEGTQTPTNNLPWPTIAEDLRRLYVDQKLSAAKIAKLYGLDKKYPSMKTAEATILYHLKKNGITRRDKAEHIRKVTTEMEDEWIRRYKGGESLKQIADVSTAAGVKVDHVTVYNHLLYRGVEMRDKVAAQIQAVTKHPRTPFTGDTKERAYLIGLIKGDFWVTRHGQAIRVKTGTTHPRMTQLIRELFGSHGAIYEYPKRSKITEFEWSLDCDLDESYEFLLSANQHVQESLNDPDLFWSFVSGFVDAEGSIRRHKKKDLASFEVSMTNLDEGLLRGIASKLSDFGLHPVLKRDKQVVNRGVINGKDYVWRIELWRYEDMTRFLKKLMSKHWEKVEKSKSALSLGYRPTPEERLAVNKRWDELIKQIKREVAEYIEVARKTYEARKEGDSE